MNNTLRIVLIVLLIIVGGAAIFYSGMYYAGARSGSYFGYGPSMMGNYGNPTYNNPPYGYEPGMMSGGGMMGGYGYGGLSNVEPVSLDDARAAVDSYLGILGNNDLAVREIMIFNNGGYAIVAEQSTGIGAFELLIDPVGQSVFPEYGPNMMWNLKYGMMSGSGGFGMMGGRGMMMRGWYGNNVQIPEVSADMPVSSDEASKTAQKYLDTYLPGVTVSDEITPFYGYYTLDVERDGKITGMLSVNGYTKQVYLHTWHGNFIEMSE